MVVGEARKIGAGRDRRERRRAGLDAVRCGAVRDSRLRCEVAGPSSSTSVTVCTMTSSREGSRARGSPRATRPSSAVSSSSARTIERVWSGHRRRAEPNPSARATDRAAGSPPRAREAMGPARCRARRRAPRAQPDTPRAPQPGGRSRRAPSSAAPAGAPAADSPPRAPSLPGRSRRSARTTSSASTCRSRARARSSSSLAASDWIPASSVRSASAGPRQSESASARRWAAIVLWPAPRARLPSCASRSNSRRSSV